MYAYFSHVDDYERCEQADWLCETRGDVRFIISV